MNFWEDKTKWEQKSTNVLGIEYEFIFMKTTNNTSIQNKTGKRKSLMNIISTAYTEPFYQIQFEFSIYIFETG